MAKKTVKPVVAAHKAKKTVKAAKMPKPVETVDIVIAFDTTGSMYPCLTQVRREVEDLTKTLFGLIPTLRIGVIAFGDYCDEDLCVTQLPLTDKIFDICEFIRNAPATHGGDADECYELVLNKARGFNWSGGPKALVLIGDANPHPVGYRYGDFKNTLSWVDEATALSNEGVRIYPIQALGRSYAQNFYNSIGRISGTPKLDLPQFSDISDILGGIACQNAGQLDAYVEQLQERKVKPSFHTLRTLAQLAGKDVSLSNRSIKIGSKYQVLDVPEKTDIKGFVQANGLYFQKGNGYYEWSKKETIQEYKVVVAQNKETGAIIEGSRARTALGLPAGERVDQKPAADSKYIGFIQSTSVNRALIAGTKFLYVVPEADGLEA